MYAVQLTSFVMMPNAISIDDVWCLLLDNVDVLFLSCFAPGYVHIMFCYNKLLFIYFVFIFVWRPLLLLTTLDVFSGIIYIY